MFNKIRQQAQRPQSRSIINRSLKAKSKLTVFMVYKMIEKRKELEHPPKNVHEIEEATLTESLFLRDPIHENPSARRQRENLRSQNRGEDIIQSATFGKRKRCQTQLETNTIDQTPGKRQNNMMTAKNITNQQSSEINRLIIQKLRKVVGKGKHKKNDKNVKIEDFGLNIIQIKRMQMPLKRSTNKAYKIIDQDNVSQQCQLNPLNNRRALRAKRSLLKEKMESKEVLLGEEERQFIQSVKFQSLDHTCMNKNISGKKLGRQNNYLFKLHKMFDCLDVILNSYHCCLSQNEAVKVDDKEDSLGFSENDIRIKSRVMNNKYFFFIGHGNNSNLIRSILRKRSWWTQTNNVNKANLVWTQLKIPEVIQKMKTFEESWSNDFLPYEELVEMKQPMSLMRTSCKKSSTTDHTESPKVKQTSLAFIFHERQDKRYYSVLNSKESAARLEKIQTPDIIHNHYCQNYMFGNKNALYYNISMYYEFIGKDLAKIVPSTFYLEKNNAKTLADFQRAYNEGKKKTTIWIVKPAENSNRGQGIIVTSSILDIKSSLHLYKKIIVQSYIKNLLLYNGRKFDIRVYMLATTVHGRLKIFWYDEGYLRTSSEYYDLTNLFDSYIHLTNDAIQKTGDNYGKYQEGNKLSYSEFQRYLEIRFPKDNVSIHEIHEQMKELARDAVKATYCRLDNQRKQFCFELFGLDFIIDSGFKPLLIEINTNPCLELSSPILQRLIPRMMENIFRLAIDPIFRPKIECSYSKSESYYIYDQTFLERNKYSLIFDERFDRDFEWEQRCKKMRGIEWGQGQQDEYENDGKLIVVDY